MPSSDSSTFSGSSLYVPKPATGTQKSRKASAEKAASTGSTSTTSISGKEPATSTSQSISSKILTSGSRSNHPLIEARIIYNNNESFLLGLTGSYQKGKAEEIKKMLEKSEEEFTFADMHEIEKIIDELAEKELKDNEGRLKTDAHFRQEFFEGKPIYDTEKAYRAIAKIAPAELLQTPFSPPIGYAGIHLWKKGYNVIKYFGHYKGGLIWKCIAPGEEKEGPKIFKVTLHERAYDYKIEKLPNSKEFLEDEKKQQEEAKQQEKEKGELTKNKQKLLNDSEYRKNYFKDHPLTPAIVSFLDDYIIPKKIRDPLGKYLPVKNSGIILWSKGYDVKEYLGKGGFGVVWKCAFKKEGTQERFKAIKVTQNDRSDYAKEEVVTSKDLKKLLEGNPKLKKYFNVLQSDSDSEPNPLLFIQKAKLAEKDLQQNKTEKDQKPKTGKKLDSLLRTSEQALKAVIELHNVGYSHNDIKPENFLKIANWKSKKQKLDARAKIEGIKDDLEKIKNITNTDEQYKELVELLNKPERQIGEISTIIASSSGKEKKSIKFLKLRMEYSQIKSISIEFSLLILVWSPN